MTEILWSSLFSECLILSILLLLFFSLSKNQKWFVHFCVYSWLIYFVVATVRTAFSSPKQLHVQMLTFQLPEHVWNIFCQILNYISVPGKKKACACSHQTRLKIKKKHELNVAFKHLTEIQLRKSRTIKFDLEGCFLIINHVIFAVSSTTWKLEISL